MEDYWWEEEKPLTLEEMKAIVEKYFKVTRYFIAPGTRVPTFVIQPLDTASPPEVIAEGQPYTLKERFNDLYAEIEPHDYYPFLRRNEKAPAFFGGIQRQITTKGPNDYILRFLPKKKEEKKARKININLILFLVTIATVMGAAVFLLMSDPYIYIIDPSPGNYYALMIGYTVAILCILGIHESGHLIACRRHKIKSSLVYMRSRFNKNSQR